LTRPFLAVRTQYREMRYRLDVLGGAVETTPVELGIAKALPLPEVQEERLLVGFRAKP